MLLLFFSIYFLCSISTFCYFQFPCFHFHITLFKQILEPELRQSQHYCQRSVYYPDIFSNILTFRHTKCCSQRNTTSSQFCAKRSTRFQYDTECVHIRETRVQAPHVTILATYDHNTGSRRSKTTKRSGIRENPKESKKPASGNKARMTRD